MMTVEHWYTCLVLTRTVLDWEILDLVSKLVSSGGRANCIDLWPVGPPWTITRNKNSIVNMMYAGSSGLDMSLLLCAHAEAACHVRQGLLKGYYGSFAEFKEVPPFAAALCRSNPLEFLDIHSQQFESISVLEAFSR
jgi:hypothetical protein